MSFVTISKPSCVPQWEGKKINNNCLVGSWVGILLNYNLDTQLIPTAQQQIKTYLEDENKEWLIMRVGEVDWKITEQKISRDIFKVQYSLYLISFSFSTFIYLPKQAEQYKNLKITIHFKKIKHRLLAPR